MVTGAKFWKLLSKAKFIARPLRALTDFYESMQITVAGIERPTFHSLAALLSAHGSGMPAWGQAAKTEKSTSLAVDSLMLWEVAQHCIPRFIIDLGSQVVIDPLQSLSGGIQIVRPCKWVSPCFSYLLLTWQMHLHFASQSIDG